MSLSKPPELSRVLQSASPELYTQIPIVRINIALSTTSIRKDAEPFATFVADPDWITSKLEDYLIAII